MRDLLLVIFLLIAIYYSFKRPTVGVAAWIWIALMAPAKWAFGFSTSFRLNLTIVFITALSYLFWRDKPKFKFTSIHFWVILFGLWMLLSTAFHLQLDSEYVWNKYFDFLKVITLFLFITLTIKTKKDIDVVVWAIVLAISAYAAMEGVKFIISGGGHRIVGRAGIIADRNDLAVAMNMCLPLMYYLWTQTKHRLLKWGLVALIVLNVVAMVGTYSRGGFIGLAILALAFWLKSNRKVLIAVMALIVLPTVISFAPQEWLERQSTIETAAVEDSSFIGRLWAWKIGTLIALDNPMTGGGFKATTDPMLWNLYAPETPNFGPIMTPEVPEYIRPKAAHNIYFQVLADGGFVALTIFLCMAISSYRKIKSVLQKAKATEQKWLEYLSYSLVLTMVGYGVTGINVSLAYFELVYAILGLIAVLHVRDFLVKGK